MLGVKTHIYIIIWNNLTNEDYLEFLDTENFNFLKKFRKIKGKFSHIIYVYIKDEIEEAKIKTKERVIILVRFPEKFIKKTKNFFLLYLYVKSLLGYQKKINFNIYINYFFKKKKIKRLFYINYNLLKINTKEKKVLLLFYKIVFEKYYLILNLKPGIFWKKLNLIEKKLKKSPKMLDIMFCISMVEVRKYFKKKLIVNLEGLKNINNFIIKLVKKYLKINKILFIYSPIFYKRTKNVKKIRSIKRNLLKNLLKNDLKNQNQKKINKLF